MQGSVEYDRGAAERRVNTNRQNRVRIRVNEVCGSGGNTGTGRDTMRE